jgi:Mce-associated membrane protein
MTAMTVAGPSWYDVLDVEPSASEADIREAWKQAVWDLEPGDRRFRLLNQAGEVLLDRDRRAAYDAELLAAELDAAHHETADPEPPDPETPGLEAAPERSAATGEPDATHATRRTGRVVPGWLLVTVATIAALVVGACAAVLATAPSDASIAEATREAQAGAERAIVPILSYDGTSADRLEADQRAAEGFMTAEYRDKYAKLFEVVKANAPATKTVVSAQVVASGIVRSGDDRVSVLVFVNRPTTNKQQKNPVVYKDQVTVTMQKVGGEWLVDDLVTSPAG